MGIAYLLGHPVGHSLSPAMHNAAFAAMGLPHSYEALDVAPAELRSAVDRLRGPSVVGANVTVPHKEAVMLLVDSWDGVAARAGAANTISRMPSEGKPRLQASEGRPRLQAWNTDRFGFERALRAKGIDVRARRVLVLGAGGAAQAIVPALAELGAAVTIANRTRGRAERLVAGVEERIRPLIGPWPSGALPADVEVVVNATSLGLEGEDPLDGIALRAGLVVVDIVPIARETPLVMRARAAGCTVVDGLAMLLYQAALSFYIWTGAQGAAVEDAMRAALPRPA